VAVANFVVDIATGATVLAATVAITASTTIIAPATSASAPLHRDHCVLYALAGLLVAVLLWLQRVAQAWLRLLSVSEQPQQPVPELLPLGPLQVQA